MLTGSHMLGSQLGTFLILILFKQLLYNKIFIGRDKELIYKDWSQFFVRFIRNKLKNVVHSFA